MIFFVINGMNFTKQGKEFFYITRTGPFYIRRAGIFYVTWS